MSQEVEDFIEHFSEKPWSDYTAADYSIEQWHAACLIHQHEGPPTSKSQCKLPVKTPSGSVNKNGVHAAAGALAGSRGGVNASSDEKASAAKALIRYYHQMDEEPPSSLLKHSNVEDFIEHYGKKGMKWGVRKARSQVKVSSDYKKTAHLRNKKPQELSNKQLQQLNARINLERTHAKNIPPGTVKKHVMTGKATVATILSVAGTAAAIYKLQENPAIKALVSSGAKKTAKFAASKAAKVPYQQLTLF